MKKLGLIGTTLSVALLSSTVMATDFQALTVLQGTTPVALEDSELAATEGGSYCNAPTLSESSGGLTYCGQVGGFQSTPAIFKSGTAPVSLGGFFIQVAF